MEASIPVSGDHEEHSRERSVLVPHQRDAAITTAACGGMIDLTERAFKHIADLVRQRFGIHLTEKKRALVRGRLHSIVRNSGFDSFEAYYDHVLNDTTGESLLRLIDRISTNHSYFFREVDHFTYLEQQVLPALVERREEERNRSIRIWSAGCAAGEEPYTLAMLIDRAFGPELEKWDVGILGTDISISALQKAKEGIYDNRKTAGVPHEFRRYFTPVDGEHIGINPRIRDMILFKRLNLMREEFPFKGKFDVVFCRNVMIYFDQPVRQELLKRFYRYMRPGGYLFIGHSETLGRHQNLFRYVRPTVYERME